MSSLRLHEENVTFRCGRLWYKEPTASARNKIRRLSMCDFCLKVLGFVHAGELNKRPVQNPSPNLDTWKATQ